MLFSSKLQPGGPTEGEEARMLLPLFPYLRRENDTTQQNRSRLAGVASRHREEPSSPDASVIISEAAQLLVVHLPWTSMILALSGLICF